MSEGVSIEAVCCWWYVHHCDLCCVEYVGYGTDLVTPIIRRYETLTVSREDLLQQLSSLTDEMKSSQNHMESLRQQHSTFKLVCDESRSDAFSFRRAGDGLRLFLSESVQQMCRGPRLSPGCSEKPLKSRRVYDGRETDVFLLLWQMTNQELSERQTQLDQLKEKNKQLEMMLHMHLGQSRDQVCCRLILTCRAEPPADSRKTLEQSCLRNRSARN